jgi:hypothetical protein
VLAEVAASTLILLSHVIWYLISTVIWLDRIESFIKIRFVVT